MKPTFYPEAFAYCVVWVALAIFALGPRRHRGGACFFRSAMFPIIMGSSLLILTKTGNFAARGKRCVGGILAVAGIVLLSYLDVIH